MSIAKAILADSPELAKIYEHLYVIKYAVQLQIFCKYSGKVLDWRKAAMAELLIDKGDLPPEKTTIVFHESLADDGLADRLKASIARAGFDLSKCEIVRSSDLIKREKELTKKANLPDTEVELPD